jgi:hypothetical protein
VHHAAAAAAAVAVERRDGHRGDGYEAGHAAQLGRARLDVLGLRREDGNGGEAGQPSVDGVVQLRAGARLFLWLFIASL